jgi:hypothetical protein
MPGFSIVIHQSRWSALRLSSGGVIQTQSFRAKMAFRTMQFAPNRIDGC